MASKGQRKAGKRIPANTHVEKACGRLALALAELTTRVIMLENERAERALNKRETRPTEVDYELIGTGFPERTKP